MSITRLSSSDSSNTIASCFQIEWTVCGKKVDQYTGITFTVCNVCKVGITFPFSSTQDRDGKTTVPGIWGTSNTEKADLDYS